MTDKFQEILQDSKKTTLNYKLYIPESFGNYADSQTKSLIDILKLKFDGLNEEFLMPPTAFEENLQNSNFSKIERQIKNSSNHYESESELELDENLQAFINKKNQVIVYLTKTYIDFYKSKNK